MVIVIFHVHHIHAYKNIKLSDCIELHLQCTTPIFYWKDTLSKFYRVTAGTFKRPRYGRTSDFLSVSPSLRAFFFLMHKTKSLILSFSHFFTHEYVHEKELEQNEISDFSRQLHGFLHDTTPRISHSVLLEKRSSHIQQTYSIVWMIV